MIRSLHLTGDHLILFIGSLSIYFVCIDCESLSSLNSCEETIRPLQSGAIFSVDNAINFLQVEGCGEKQDEIDHLKLCASKARQLRQHTIALQLHRAHLATLQSHLRQFQNVSVWQLLALHVDLVTDQYLQLKFNDALAEIARTRSSFQMTPDVDHLLRKLQSYVLECMGRTPEALAALGSSDDDPSQPLSLRLQDGARLLQLLRRLQRNSVDAPQLAALASREARVTKLLLRLGPWNSVEQMPVIFNRHLPGKAWPEATPPIAAAATLLQEHTASLRAEYQALAHANLLWEDPDCLVAPGGWWRRFEVTGIETALDANNCSVATPAACALLRAVAAAGLSHVRAAYSTIGPHTSLRPHYGPTNERLKLHLGLVVPPPRESSNGPCARMRVGTEWRAWANGSVLFFDDSFEHEVESVCDSERVVFQLVVRHPNLPPAVMNMPSMMLH